MGKQTLEPVYTPSWAEKQLPECAALVKIKDRWWLILWTEEHCVAAPDPDRWAYTGGQLGESEELQLWFPPRQHVAELIAEGLVKRADEPR